MSQQNAMSGFGGGNTMGSPMPMMAQQQPMAQAIGQPTGLSMPAQSSTKGSLKGAGAMLGNSPMGGGGGKGQ